MTKERKREAAGRLTRLLLLVIALLLSAVPAVYMNSVYGYLPVVTVLALLLLSLVCLFVLVGRIGVEADSGSSTCYRGDILQIRMKLVNRSALFCPRARAYVYISDIFGETDDMRIVTFTVNSKGTVDIGLEVEMPHVGCFDIGIKSIEIYDFFGIFSRKKPVSGGLSAVVTPHVRPIDSINTSDNLLTEVVNETKVTVVGGTDYTGVRQYTIGDPMKQIHWKLSAHSREYVTKVQESNRQQEFAVLLDFASSEKSKEVRMDINDCLVETSLSLVEAISDRDAGCALIYTDRDGMPVRTNPSGRDDDVDLVRSFAVIGTLSDENGICQLLRQESEGQNRCSNVIVVTSQVTDGLLQELYRIRSQRRTPELYFIIPAGWSSRERETACAPLRTLSDSDIPCTVVSTDINSKILKENGRGSS